MNRNEKRAPKNRTLTLKAEEREAYLARCLRPHNPASRNRKFTPEEIENRTMLADIYQVLDLLPEGFVDLLFVDPPYNMNKHFASRSFSRRGEEEYEAYIESWLFPLLPALKPDASVYICADWRSSAAVYRALNRRLKVLNRITWEREKGRGAKRNWKNSSEDIWFASASNNYYFDVDAVKMRRKVRAPYRKSDGSPRDWVEDPEGKFRLTHPSNLWNDITVPYWSMPENTDHPAQKAEKLLAKIILASSAPGALVFDPFAGTGTSAVVAKKLGRRYFAVEQEEEYAALAEKRLEIAEQEDSIQGYRSGTFLHRNTTY